MNFKLACFVVILVWGFQGEPLVAQTTLTSVDDIIDRAVQREKENMKTLAGYTPIVETYLQRLEPHVELGFVPSEDKYFLGKLDLKSGVSQKSLIPGATSGVMDIFTRLFSIKYVPDGFAQMIVIDAANFDRNNYNFTFVRREFLGEVRCVVFDVQPKATAKPKGATFLGRIWVEDENYNIVRFNGTYAPSRSTKMYFHFDSWRENIGPNQWLPSHIYVEESDAPYSMLGRKLRFKGQTRIWGYNIGRPNWQDELTALKVESGQVRDQVDQTENLSPVQKLRAWERQAEDNTINRLQEAGLLAPAGPVDAVLETVVTNLEVTNNIDIQPGVRARVLLTSPLESFTIGQTIVLSRGLVDVLPDEASLAMVLAHELAHVALGHKLDTKFAFSDRLIFEDVQTFRQLTAKRDLMEEEAADQKAAEILQNSPYKDKLENAGLFLRALDERARKLPRLLTPHMGNYMLADSKVKHMAGLLKETPALEHKNLKQIAALPLGARLRVNPWDNTVEMTRTEPVALVSPREKMLFEVTPIFLYLTRQKTPANASRE